MLLQVNATRTSSDQPACHYSEIISYETAMRKQEQVPDVFMLPRSMVWKRDEICTLVPIAMLVQRYQSPYGTSPGSLLLFVQPAAIRMPLFPIQILYHHNHSGPSLLQLPLYIIQRTLLVLLQLSSIFLICPHLLPTSHLPAFTSVSMPEHNGKKDIPPPTPTPSPTPQPPPANDGNTSKDGDAEKILEPADKGSGFK